MKLATVTRRLEFDIDSPFSKEVSSLAVNMPGSCERFQLCGLSFDIVHIKRELRKVFKLFLKFSIATQEIVKICELLS